MNFWTFGRVQLQEGSHILIVSREEVMKIGTAKVMAMLVATAMLSSVCYAKGGWRGNREEREKVFEKLNLSPEQKNKLEAVKTKMGAESKALWTQKREMQEKLRAAFEANESEENLRVIHKGMQEIRSKMSELRFERMLQIRRVLDANQRQQLQSMGMRGFKER